MADTKLVICEKCLGTGHVNGGNENSAWSKTCEDCHGIGFSRDPMTNADRIRAMNDEELSEYIAGLIDDANSGSVIYSNRPEEWLEWLKQPAE